ncbi:hypothetical protein K4K56_006255 [Colletotrichum sp. SAR 10_98]|nr:hypothetical protein K4K56_006255 [Colletotrichum sp. SAR 10_98]
MSMTFTLHDAPVTATESSQLLNEPKFTLEAFDRSDPLDKIIQSLKYNGGVRIRGFLSAQEIAEAERAAGDAFFMLSSCYHGAGQNTTEDSKRLVYALFMQLPHLRQEENFALYLPHDVVKSYPLEVQRRLGYDVALPNLGWVDHSTPLESVLKQKGADKRVIPGYNPVEGIADERSVQAHELRVDTPKTVAVA